MHAKINVMPVANKFLIILGSTFVAFNACIMPSGPELAELNIEMAANTKPKRIPATVERTPAVLSISVCAIGKIYLLNAHVNSALIIMFIITFINIMTLCYKLNLVLL